MCGQFDCRENNAGVCVNEYDADTCDWYKESEEGKCECEDDDLAKCPDCGHQQAKEIPATMHNPAEYICRHCGWGSA